MFLGKNSTDVPGYGLHGCSQVWTAWMFPGLDFMDIPVWTPWMFLGIDFLDVPGYELYGCSLVSIAWMFPNLDCMDVFEYGLH